MIFWGVVGFLLIASGWPIPGMIALAGVLLYSRYGSTVRRSLSVLPEAIAFCLAVTGIVVALVEQALL